MNYSKAKQKLNKHEYITIGDYCQYIMYSVTGGSPSAFMWCYHPSKRYSKLNSWPPIFINNLCSVVQWGEWVRLQWHPGMFGGHEEGEGQNFDLISGAGSLVKQKSNTKQALQELLIISGSLSFSELLFLFTFRAIWEKRWSHQQFTH